MCFSATASFTAAAVLDTIGVATLRHDQAALSAAETHTQSLAAGRAYAVASIAKAQADLARADLNISYTTIRAPIDGIVTRKLKNVGETVTMMPPTVVLEVQDHSAIELRARIPEGALKSVHENDRIPAHFGALELARELRVDGEALLHRHELAVKSAQAVGVHCGDDVRRAARLRAGLFLRRLGERLALQLDRAAELVARDVGRQGERLRPLRPRLRQREQVRRERASPLDLPRRAVSACRRCEAPCEARAVVRGR